MKRTQSVLVMLLVLVAGVPAVNAQTSRETMIGAAEFRRELALSVAGGKESVAQALQRLGERKVASGLATLSPHEDQAQAASDIAQDLLGRERPDLAEPFFRVAEQNLVQATRGGGAVQSKQKAQLLKKLAAIRGSYLSQRQQAKSDIEEAARLDPGDETIAALAAQARRISEGVSASKRRN